MNNINWTDENVSAFATDVFQHIKNHLSTGSAKE